MKRLQDVINFDNWTNISYKYLGAKNVQNPIYKIKCKSLGSNITYHRHRLSYQINDTIIIGSSLKFWKRKFSVNKFFIDENKPHLSSPWLMLIRDIDRYIEREISYKKQCKITHGLKDSEDAIKSHKIEW